MRTIAHLSDIHFGRIDARIVESVIADTNAFKPSLTVVSGDFTQRARAWQYREAAAFLRRLPSPTLVIPGNHDIPLYDVCSRFLCPLRNYRRYITNDLMPVYQDQELLVVGVNTARPLSLTYNGFWKDGRISARQLRAVGRVMERAPTGLFKVVMTHHPFIPPTGQPDQAIVLGARRALEEMQVWGVDLCLAGHLHLGYSDDVRTHHEEVERSILSVQAGTATSTRRRGEPNAYNRLTIESEQVRIEVRTWDGGDFKASTTTRFVRKDGAWRRK